MSIQFDKELHFNAYNKSNKKRKKSIPITENWGLHYFNEENLKFLNNSSNLVEEAVNYDPAFVFTDKSEIKDLLSLAKSDNENGVQLLREATEKLKESMPVIQSCENLLEAKKTLDNINNWNIYYANAKNRHEREELEKLQAMWHHHSDFFRHSDNAMLFLLYKVAHYEALFNDALSELEDHLISIFKIKEIPLEIAAPYKHYLLEKLKELKNIKEKAINEILTRLKAVQLHENISESNVTFSIIRRLQQLNHLNSNWSWFNPNILNAHRFDQLHKAVEAHGNYQQKKEFKNLSWNQAFKFNSHFNLETVIVGNTNFVIPKKLSRYLPRSRSKLDWFFPDKRARFQFFEEHRQVFSSLVFFNPIHRYRLETLSVEHPFIQQKLAHYQLLRSAQQKADQEKIPWWQFRRKSLQEKWKKQLGSYVLQAQTSFVNWFSHVQEELAVRPDFLKVPAQNVKLWNTLHTVNSIVQPDLSAEHKRLLTATVNQLELTLKQDPLSEYVQVMNNVSSHPEQVSALDKQYAVEMIEQIALRDKGMKPEEKLMPLLNEAHGHDAAFNTLLPHISVPLDERDTESTYKQIKRIDKWLLEQVRVITDEKISIHKKIAHIKKIQQTALLHASASLKEKFTKMVIPHNETELSSYLTNYISIVEEIANQYTDRYAEKVYGKLKLACEDKLKALTGANPTKINVVKDILQRLIRENKQKINEIELEPQEAGIVTIKKYKKLIQFQSSIDVYLQQAKRTSSLREKNFWLDMVQNKTEKKYADLIPMVQKRYFHTS
ncbi:MAG TPA: hypothetical protein VHZ76_10130 [Gammaproteobacteria bacterium]|jgi:hypothetical protein|nr:hypothetical protein [Gammaproteobacteria bacterium]